MIRLKRRERDLFITHVGDLKIMPNNQASGHCPFHDDKNKSFSVNLDTGLWKCHAGCGSGAAQHFAHRIEYEPTYYEKTTRKNSSESQRVKKNNLTPLVLNDEAVKYLMYLEDNWQHLPVPRSWNIDWVIHTCTGYDPKSGQFIYSHTNKDGDIINIHWHKGKSHWRGEGSSKLFPLHFFNPRMSFHFDPVKKLIICEGEKDCITLLSNGYQAVTNTTGAANVPKDINPLKDFIDVVIIYDNDDPGKQGAKKMAQAIKSINPAGKVRIGEWK